MSHPRRLSRSQLTAGNRVFKTTVLTTNISSLSFSTCLRRLLYDYAWPERYKPLPSCVDPRRAGAVAARGPSRLLALHMRRIRALEYDYCVDRSCLLLDLQARAEVPAVQHLALVRCRPEWCLREPLTLAR